MSLPTDAAARKRLQLYTFMFKYFPDAWLAIVSVARAGNDQHNPGQPMHWAREKSKDQMNAAFNHIFDYGMGAQKDVDGEYHLAKAAWRLMAQLQLDIEANKAAAQPGIPAMMTMLETDVCWECQGHGAHVAGCPRSA